MGFKCIQERYLEVRSPVDMAAVWADKAARGVQKNISKLISSKSLSQFQGKILIAIDLPNVNPFLYNRQRDC